jgi:putative flippase GtrA
VPDLDLKREAGLLARFGGAGVLNTALGLSVILALDLGLGLDRRLANAVGYVAGATLGLVLQKRFVFRQANHAPGANFRYLLVMLLAFGLNQLALTTAGVALPDDRLGRAAAQLVGMTTYTVSQFLLFRFWVFRPAA